MLNDSDGYVCWTAARIIRKPGRAIGGFRGLNTRLIDALLEASAGVAPQRRYEQEYESTDLRLKTVDVIATPKNRNRDFDFCGDSSHTKEPMSSWHWLNLRTEDDDQ